MANPNQRSSEIPLSRFSPSYLHSNSTSHAWPFGAIAELIDNAYDPDVNASYIYIDHEEISGYPCLTFTDDGNGLDVKKMHKMLSFGFSDKTEINGKRPIGVYGNGFKSGSMRLGKDAIVFSKVKDNMVIGFLSQSYLKAINAEDIRVPIVQFNQKLKEHEVSLSHIKIFSIFKSDLAIKEQFNKISSAKGTRIVIYNLCQEKSINGQYQVMNRYELDCKKDQNDILIAGGGRFRDGSLSMTKQFRGQHHSEEAPRCDFSLRAYCSVLYLNPRIRIYLRKKKVRTVMIAKSLQETEKDVYRPWGGNSKVKITFGFNPKKYPYGVCFYHNNRLIKSYQRLGYQIKADHRGSEIVGVIDCNFLEPTHNKQDFNRDTAYSRCIKAVGDKLNDYWNEKRETDQVSGGTSNQFLGNTNPDTPDYTWVQCDKCSKFRKLPDSVDPDKLPDQWFCSMNKNLNQNNCVVPEEPEDSDEELTRPTYDKKHKKREAEKRLQQKLAENVRREERIKQEKEKNQIHMEKIKALEVELEMCKTKDSQEEHTKLEKIEQEIKQHKEEDKSQKLMIQQLLNLKSELESQNQSLEKRIADALTDTNRSEKKKSNSVDNDGYIWIDSEEEEDHPPIKKMKTEPISEDLQRKQGSSSSNGNGSAQLPKIKQEAISRDQESDLANQHSHLKRQLRKSEEKLKNLRGHVIQLLKMVVTEEDMHLVIDNLQGDKVDEILQEVMNFKELE